MIDRHCTINGVMFVGLVCLTSNHMFGSGDFWDKSPSWFFKISKLSSLYSSNFKIFKNPSGNLSQIIRPNMWLLLLIGFRGKKRPNERTVWHIDPLTISFHQFSLRLTNTLLWKLHQRRNENDKNTNFFMKNKKMPKKYI